MKTSNNLTAYTNHLIQTYLIIAAVYVVTNALISHAARYLERRMSGRAARIGHEALEAGIG
jgi:glutamate transport system permease protein